MTKRRCASCDETFKKNDQITECDSCKKRFHQACTNLDSNEAQVLSRNKTKFKWFCIFCEPDVMEMLSNFQKFKKVSVEISKMKADMEEKLNSIERRINICETRENTGVDQSEIREQISRQTEEDKKEEKLIDAKKNNMVYFSVPESGSDSVEERIKHDYQQIREAHDEDIIHHNQIETMFRVGKKGTTARPLVVKFKTFENKQRALKNSGDLKIKCGNEIKPIYASTDKTEKQRAEHRKLVEKLKERKENGETNIGIRDGNIVQIFRKDTAARQTSWASLFTR